MEHIMELTEAKFKFEERCYLWAKDLLVGELSEGFPLLRDVKGTLAQHYVRILERLESNEAHRMAHALLRRGVKPEILDKWGDAFTEEDQTYVDLYLQMIEVEDHKAAMERSPFESMQKKKFNRKVFRNQIKTALEPVLGVDYEDWGGGNWRYCTSVGVWKVMTWIDTGGRYHQLCYDHSVQVSDVVRLCEATSLFRWFGIAGQTDWQDLEDGDVEPVASSLAEIVDLFIKAVPKLLRGLNTNRTILSARNNAL